MNKIFSIRGAASVLGALAIAAAVAGCFDSGAASRSIAELKNGAAASEAREELAKRTPPGWYRGEQPVLRSRADLARGRLWVLTSQGVELYDVRTREKLAQVALPHWTWVGEPYSCSPDLTLGPKGEALVSSNAVPKLWRVDPASFSVSEHELVLDADKDRDVGFSGMAYSPEQGVFFAVSNIGGSLWRIDPLLSRAQKIPLSSPIPNACSLTLQFRGAQQKKLVGLCVRAVKAGRATDMTLRLAPDQRSGYVETGSCAA